MTASRPARPPLEKLDAHLPWVTLACANFAYTPGILFFARIGGPVVNEYIVERVGLVSLLIMIGTVTYHAILRAAARAEAEEGRARFRGTRPLQRFQIHRAIAFMGMACGAYLLWMIFREHDELTRIFYSVMFAMTCLPGCVIWLWTIQRDVHLVRRLVRVIP